MLVFNKPPIGLPPTLEEHHPDHIPIAFWAKAFGLTSEQVLVQDSTTGARLFNCSSSCTTLDLSLVSTPSDLPAPLLLVLCWDSNFRLLYPREASLFRLLLDAFQALGGTTERQNLCVRLDQVTLTAIFNSTQVTELSDLPAATDDEEEEEEEDPLPEFPSPTEETQN